MRAKEYIYIHRKNLKHAEIVSQVILDLLPLRLDRIKTGEYMSNRLFADTRYQQFMLQKELFERGNAMQINKPAFKAIEGEVSMDIALEVREELFQIIKGDGSFGYLFYILGTEHNARHYNDPIDCIPNEDNIAQCIIENRDDYPKDNLDEYINENLNYQQYNKLIDGQYWEENDKQYLDYFNRVYEIYDELRIRKQSIISIKSYLREQEFKSDLEKYWILTYIITLIENSRSEDDSIIRCEQEIMRVVAPLKEQYELVSQEDFKSPVYITERKGNRINIIRVLNVLYELGIFCGEKGSPISKKEFMTNMGKAMNLDLKNYDKDLSRALSDSTTLEKHLQIFKEMAEKMKNIFDLH